MTERFGAKDEKSKLLRFHTQTGGSTLTAQQPENNIVRVTLQSLAAALGGTQSLHTNGFDEALGLPTDAGGQDRPAHPADRRLRVGRRRHRRPAGRLVLRGVAHRRGRGSGAWAYLERIDGMGGAVAAIEARYMQEEIEQAAYAYAKAVDAGEKVIVGVNRFVDEEPEPTEVFPIDPELQRSQIARVKRVREPSGTRRRWTPPWPTWRRRPGGPRTCSSR